MYKYQTGPEPDHSGYEWVKPHDQCETCGKTNQECVCGDISEDDPEEHSKRNQRTSFYDRYGYDERDGPSEDEDEEERGYRDDPDEPLDYR